MGQLYLGRHGQACFGSTEYDRLSPLGLTQARLLGEWFGHLDNFAHLEWLGEPDAVTYR